MEKSVGAALPQVFVSDFAASLAYYTGVLGFGVDFVYGDPPFYGQVRRGAARLCLRHVDTPVADRQRASRDELLTALIHAVGLPALFHEFCDAGAAIHEALCRKPWGGTTCIVADPDGNLLMFVEE